MSISENVGGISQYLSNLRTAESYTGLKTEVKRTLNKVCLLYTSGEDDRAYHICKDIDLIKYSVYPEGFMVRASSMEEREQVRVGKKAVKEGLSFAQMCIRDSLTAAKNCGYRSH